MFEMSIFPEDTLRSEAAAYACSMCPPPPPLRCPGSPPWPEEELPTDSFGGY